MVSALIQNGHFKNGQINKLGWVSQVMITIQKHSSFAYYSSLTLVQVFCTSLNGNTYETKYRLFSKAWTCAVVRIWSSTSFRVHAAPESWLKCTTTSCMVPQTASYSSSALMSSKYKRRICLVNESWDGTSIRRYLVSWPRVTVSPSTKVDHNYSKKVSIVRV